MNIELTNREKNVIFFALNKLIDASKDMQIAALMDNGNRIFQPGAADAFRDLVSESEELIIKVRDHVDNPLVAAAPELLETLERVMSWIENWSPTFTYEDEWDADEEKARAAIAKAQGKA